MCDDKGSQVCLGIEAKLYKHPCVENAGTHSYTCACICVCLIHFCVNSMSHTYVAGLKWNSDSLENEKVILNSYLKLSSLISLRVKDA